MVDHYIYYNNYHIFHITAALENYFLAVCVYNIILAVVVVDMRCWFIEFGTLEVAI